ncbi:MAG TPA: hypothetical protein PKC18_16105 [Lacipirellulaceae bacterium]|nr:hypothetical protein [Lacipirellulaceae bacterium]
METLTAADVCEWLEISIDELRKLRRRRDRTAFPPPLLGDAGLVWYEQDVVNWICYLQDWIDAGSTAEALEQLTPPTFMACEKENGCSRHTKH